jgi:hypothetical protein
MANEIPKMGTHEEEREYRVYRRSRIGSGQKTEALIPYTPKIHPSLDEILPKVSPIYAELMDVTQEDAVQH